MAQKVLSIVVPAYNMEAYLEKCLASIAEAEQLDKLEVMVVDDGGTDGSLAIAQEYARHYPASFRAIHKPNGGHGSVINYGIAHATGAYFKVIDGDDWVDPEALDGLITLLESTDADIIASDYYLVDDRTEKTLERRRAAVDACRYATAHPISALGEEGVLKIHSLTVRTALLTDNAVRVDEGCFYEDAEFSIYPLAFAATILFDDHGVYHYRIGRAGQSVDPERIKRNKDHHTRIMMALLAFRDAHRDLDPQTLDAIDRAIAYYTQNQYQIFLSIGNSPENRASLIAFDQLLQKDYPGIYSHAQKRSIWLIRKSGYRLFPLGCLAYRAYRTLR